MSQEFIDSEILADFFIEAKEHLESIEPNLLLLESQPENLSLLNDIFRPMHSLKGASGFMGFGNMNRLAHKAESILDELRQGTMTVSSEIMDTVLSATDALRTMVDNLESQGTEGEVAIDSIINSFELMLGEKQGTVSPSKHIAEPELVSNAEPELQIEPTLESKPESKPESEPESELGSGPESKEESKEDLIDLSAKQRAPESCAEDKTRFEYELDPNFDDSPYLLTTVGEGHLNDFLEEATDIIGNLNNSLLMLESSPQEAEEIINDTFRYFHNLKGNSGIIGFRELNMLTHEAETLLNKIRKGEMELKRPLVDLLLTVVDMIEEMVSKVEPSKGEVLPIDPSGLSQILARATESGELSGMALSEDVPQEKAQECDAPQKTFADLSSIDDADLLVFRENVSQQIAGIETILAELRKDATQKEHIDNLFRGLQTVQHAAAYMDLEECAVYAERTAGLVDQARNSDMDFYLMLDILDQESAILHSMLDKALEDMERESSTEQAEPLTTVADEHLSQAEEVRADVQPESPTIQQIAQQPAQQTHQQTRAQAVAPPPVPTSATKPTIKDTAPSTKSVPAPVLVKPKTSSTIRVDHQKLDHLMNLIGELIINRNRYTLLARALEEGQQEVHAVAQQLTETTYAMARISDDLQDTIMNVRMVSVQTVFSRFPRLVRDLARKSGKQVELITEGEETELDKSVVEEIGDPLVHLIRNSLDHGLEPEEERIAAGKTPIGHVWLRAYHKGNSVAIEVEDDGRGIDPEKMRAIAIKKGVLTADEAKNLDDREAIELIFHPGFSSAEKITDISGRGVGMDVVKNNIKNLKGSVHTRSELGKGTKMVLSLPLTLAIIDALIVEVAGDTFAIPLDAVSETTKIHAEKLSDVNQRKAITLRGEVLGIIELAELLDLPMNDKERDILPVVIVHDNDRRVGLVVDRLLERQEIVIKPLGQYLSEFDLEGISGATIMGDGSVVLILDPHEIYSLATNYTKPVAAMRSKEREKKALEV